MSWKLTFAFSLAILMSSLFSEESRADRSLKIQIALMANSNPLDLGFIVKNCGVSDVARSDPGTEANPIFVLLPDGAVISRESISDVFSKEPLESTKLKPNESHMWITSVNSLLKETKQSGLARAYWEFQGIRSNEVLIIAGGQPTDINKPTTRFVRDLSSIRRNLSGTPIGVLLQFYEAYDGSGDLDDFIAFPDRDVSKTVAEWKETGRSAEGEIAVALIERAEAAKRLKHSIRERFGETALHTRWPFEICDDALVDSIINSTVEYPEYFLEARIARKGSAHPMTLVREGRNWRLPMSNFVTNGTVHPAVKTTTDAIKRFAEAIDAGTYPSVEQARHTIREELGSISWDGG